MADYQIRSSFLKIVKQESKPKTNVCSENKQNVVRICANSKCKKLKNKLICGNIECECEKKNHPDCEKFLNFNNFKTVIRQYNEKIKKVYKPIFSSLNSIFQDLTQLYNKLQKQMITYMMCQQFSQSIKQLNQNGILDEDKSIKLCKVFQKYPKYELKIKQQTIKNYELQLREKMKSMKQRNKNFGSQIIGLLMKYENQFKSQIQYHNNLKILHQKKIDRKLQKNSFD